MSKTTFIAAGDAFMTRRLPAGGYEGFEELRDCISAHDVKFQPWDAYTNRNMPLDTKVGAYMDDRSCNGTKGYCVQWPIWNAVMPAWTMENGKITEIKLYPIELGMDKPRSQKGVPVMNHSHETLEYLQEISRCYNTKIDIADGVGTIRL